MRLLRPAFYAVLLAALAALHLRLMSYAFDDAYIHIRIAQHLLTSGQPYFNLGEPVMASSSLLWTLVLAALFRLGASPLPSIAFVNSVLTTLCVLTYSTLLHREVHRTVPAIWCDLATATLVVPILAAASFGLMETPFAMLLTGVGLLLVRSGRPSAFALFGAAAFVRTELAFLLLVFCVYAVASTRFTLRTVIAHLCSSALLLAAYQLLEFRTVIPQAVIAKSRGYDVPIGEVLLGITNWLEISHRAIYVGAFPAAIVVIWLALDHKSVSGITKATFVAGAGIIGAYLVTRALVFEWYRPLYFVLITWPVLVLLMSPVIERRRRSTFAIRGVYLMLLAGLIAPAEISFVRFVKGAVVNAAYAPSFGQGARVHSYIAVGRRLSAQFPGYRLLTSEIGGIGFGFEGPIDDGFGLVSPGALKYQPLKVPGERSNGDLGAIPPGYVAEIDSPIIVSYDIFIEAFLRSAVSERYVRLEMPAFMPDDIARARDAGEPLELWGIRSLNLFVRRDVYNGRMDSLPVR